MKLKLEFFKSTIFPDFDKISINKSAITEISCDFTCVGLT